MRAVRVEMEPFELVNILEMNCTREVNCHGVLRVSGLIRQEKEQEYLDMAGKETWVNVNAILENGEKTCFFHGILTGLWIKRADQAPVLAVEIKTGSALLDMQAHTRSFQDTSFLYSEVIRACLNPAEGKVIMLEKKEETIGRFLLQYHETDWEFMRRLASYAGTVLIPEDVTPGKKVYFGYRKNQLPEELKADSYRMEQDYEGYRKKESLGMDGLVLWDSISYIVQTREIYKLGECVNFAGRTYTICRIDSSFKGQELFHEYRLSSKKSGQLPAFYNHALAGVSLKAEVIAVEKTMVKVRLQEDENKNHCRNRWFDYATVYSTPDGTGWYCMPEIGDTVRLVFPDAHEDNAYVSGSIHTGAAGGRSNPEEKSWKNKQNKEILFTPGSIILRNNNGLLLELSDGEGIRICSNRDIMMQSEGDIRIVSGGGGIQMSSGSSILMQQGAAKIKMDDAIHISGGKIYMN